jgi:hypothetical protein
MEAHVRLALESGVAESETSAIVSDYNVQRRGVQF